MVETMLIGHRGARYEAPENTVPGFRYAISLGLSAIEFDVRMTADGHLVVIHDETVDRTTNGTGRVADLTLDQLQALDARSIFPEWPEPCVVPTLTNVLGVVGGLPELFIEIKSDEPDRLEQIVPATIKEIRRHDLVSQVTLTSFDPVALAIVQCEAPDFRRGYIGKWDSTQFLDQAVKLGCQQIDVHHPTGDHGLVVKARSLGMRVVCWPTNSREDLESVLAFNPDLFCTDKPTLLGELYNRDPMATSGE